MNLLAIEDSIHFLIAIDREVISAEWSAPLIISFQTTHYGVKIKPNGLLMHAFLSNVNQWNNVNKFNYYHLLSSLL